MRGGEGGGGFVMLIAERSKETRNGNRGEVYIFLHGFPSALRLLIVAVMRVDRVM